MCASLNDFFINSQLSKLLFLCILPLDPFLFGSCLVIRNKNSSDSSKFVKNSDEPEVNGTSIRSM